MHYRVSRDQVTPYITKDTSEIREYINPTLSEGCKNLSLAEATIKPGCCTQNHIHPESEEIYYFLCGSGRMIVEGDEFAVTVGDSVFIPAGAAHQCFNTGSQPMRILCHCSPAYRHDDTILLD